MAHIVWDRRKQYVYDQTEKETFEIIQKRYHDFVAILNDVNTEPVKVFDGIKLIQSEELDLIREVSRELQKKKEDDINKAKADAEAAAEEAKKVEDSKEEQTKLTEESNASEETDASQENNEA